MKQVAFSSLSVGSKFVYKGSEYVKEDKKKISCCKFTNASLSADSSKKIGVAAGTVVEVAE